MDFKNQVRHYIMWTPELEELRVLDRSMFKKIHDQHWLIESFHRVIKQVCNIERFHIRNRNDEKIGDGDEVDFFLEITLGFDWLAIAHGLFPGRQRWRACGQHHTAIGPFANLSGFGEPIGI